MSEFDFAEAIVDDLFDSLDTFKFGSQPVFRDASVVVRRVRESLRDESGQVRNAVSHPIPEAAQIVAAVSAKLDQVLFPREICRPVVNVLR